MQQTESVAEGLGLSSQSLVGVVALLAVVSLIVTRVFANALRGNKPPVFEGIPFVGGLLKFSKVCAATGYLRALDR